jgi:ribose 5-phosphate isomerase A
MSAKGVAQLKQQAAERAVDVIKSGMIVGLGAGSTALYALRVIADRLRSGQFREIVAVPCSTQTEAEAQKLGIPLRALEEQLSIDVTIDGADEVDPNLDLIKGGGGALLREKIVAQASRREIIVVDESKLSPMLGTHWPVPVEVVPFGWRSQANYLESLGARVTRRQDEEGMPFRTDQGNFILDCDFGQISQPAQLAGLLNQRAGIVEHGLFLGMATDVIVASNDGVRHLKREDVKKGRTRNDCD